MALTRTLLEMRTDIRDKGGYHRSAVFTDAKLTRWINEEARAVREIIQDSDEDYYTEPKALFTASGSDFINLPDDFYRLRGLFKVISGDNLIPLQREDLKTMVKREYPWVGAYGRSYFYRLQSDRLYLSPTPNASEELRLYYIPVMAELAADADTWDTIHGFDALVVAKVLLTCDQREEKPLTERRDTVSMLEKRVMSAVKRDSNEPFLLTDNSGGGY